MLHSVEWNKEKIASFWDNYNKFLEIRGEKDGYFSEITGPYLLKNINHIVKLKQKNILDYGCGQGDLIHTICEKYNPQTICGVDLSEEAVIEANKKNKKYACYRGAYPIIDDKIPLENESFDVIFLLEVIEHLSDDDINFALNKIKKYLKPDGFIVISTPNNENLGKATFVCPDCGCYFHSFQHLRSWTSNSLDAFMQKQGFKSYKTIETTLFAPEFIKPFFAKCYSIVAKILNKNQKNLIYIGQKEQI